MSENNKFKLIHAISSFIETTNKFVYTKMIRLKKCVVVNILDFEINYHFLILLCFSSSRSGGDVRAKAVTVAVDGGNAGGAKGGESTRQVIATFPLRRLGHRRGQDA